MRTAGFMAMNNRLSTILSIGLFVVLAGYVSFSGVRLGLVLWQRFAGAGELIKQFPNTRHGS